MQGPEPPIQGDISRVAERSWDTMLRSVFGPRIGCFVAQNAFFGARRMGMVTMTRSEGSLLGGMVPLAHPMGSPMGGPLSSLIGSPLTSPLGTPSETPDMHLDSVMRKRRTKMKKHKLRKRRKRQKAEKRKQSQG